MSSIISLASSSLAVAGLLLLSGCSVSRARMQVSPSLQQTTPLPVGGRQLFRPSYQFGEFGTAELRRGALTTTSGTWQWPAHYQRTSRQRQRMHLVMQPVAGTSWQADGAYLADDKDVGLRTGANSSVGVSLAQTSTYACMVHAPQQRDWELLLENSNGLGQRWQAPQGTFSRGDTVLTVRPVQHLLRPDGSAMALPGTMALGYEFVRPNGTVVAAVELLGRGRVWVLPALAPEVKGPVAAAVTALLMRGQ